MVKKRSVEGSQQEPLMTMTQNTDAPFKSARVVSSTSADVYPSLEGRALPTTTVNTSNLGEVKLAIDEAVKKVGSRSS